MHKLDLLPSRLEKLRELSSCDFDIGTVAGLSTWDTSSHSCTFDVGEGNTVICGPEVRTTPGVNIKIKGKKNTLWLAAGTDFKGTSIEIKGENCLIAFGPQVRMRHDRFYASGSNSSIIIGAATTCVGGAQILNEADDSHIVVGNDCMFAHGVVLRTSDGHTIFNRLTHEPINKPQSIVVHHHVWMANSAKVNKGSVVGSGTIIAQTSVVSGKLQSNCVYGGVPARMMRQGVVWSRTDDYDKIPVSFR